MKIYECVNKNTDKGNAADIVYFDFQKASLKSVKETKLPQAILGRIFWQLKKSLLVVNFVDQFLFILTCIKLVATCIRRTGEWDLRTAEQLGLTGGGGRQH